MNLINLRDTFTSKRVAVSREDAELVKKATKKIEACLRFFDVYNQFKNDKRGSPFKSNEVSVIKYTFFLNWEIVRPYAHQGRSVKAREASFAKTMGISPLYFSKQRKAFLQAVTKPQSQF
jgi:hypothetical protein